MPRNRTLERGRRRAEERMTDTWRCVRVSPGEFDDDTGRWSPETATTFYDGPGRLADDDNQGTRDESQGETTTVGALRLSLPVAKAAGVRIDDIFECTASVDDPSLVGTKVRVADLHLQTQSTARRLGVEVESWPTT